MMLDSVKARFEGSLMGAGTLYHGAPLTSDEVMGPLLESIIVIQWLKAIHPGLPNYVMEHAGVTCLASLRQVFVILVPS